MVTNRPERGLSFLAKLKRLRDPQQLRAHFQAILRRANPRARVQEAKTQWWQTEAGAEAFVEGSDATSIPAAALMDAVLNDFFLQHCSPKSKILDLGCGHGIVSIFLARHGHSVTACDVSERLLRVLAQNSDGLNIDIRQGDAHKIPARNGEFDIVVARMFLGHFPDWADIVGEMARCCRPGGKLLLHLTSQENAEFGRRHGGYDCTFVSSPDLSVRNVNPSAYYAEVSLAEIKRLCVKYKLKVVEQAPNTFFLHNRLIGNSLGTERFQAYQSDLTERVKDPKIMDFVVWFEKNAIRFMPSWISYYNVLVLEKNQ
jgi:2-polyprenyl-3-methyl-5-hydroxy-6-metoxy-1,4-benzoquinol methylase